MNNFLGGFGMELIPNAFLTIHKQYRFPSSKKGRIQKKWRRRPANWRYFPSPQIWVMGSRVYAHPLTMDKLVRQIKAASPSTSPS